MPGEKHNVLLVTSVALLAALAALAGSVVYLGMESIRPDPGRGVHYDFSLRRATLKASAYFTYLEKEGSPAAAGAARLAKKVLPFLNAAPGPAAGTGGRGVYAGGGGPRSAGPGGSGGTAPVDQPDWDSVYQPPYPTSGGQQPVNGFGPDFSPGPRPSRPSRKVSGDDSEPPDHAAGGKTRGKSQDTARRAEPQRAGQDQAGSGYGTQGRPVTAQAAQSGRLQGLRGQAPAADDGALEQLRSNSAGTYMPKIQAAAAKEAAAGAGGAGGSGVPGVSRPSGSSAQAAAAAAPVSKVMNSVVADKRSGRESSAVNSAEAAKKPPATLTKPGSVTPSAHTPASTQSQAAYTAQLPAGVSGQSSHQAPLDDADPEDPAQLTPQRSRALQGEIETSLKQIENAYGKMTDMFYTDCTDNSTCAEHGLKGGFVTMTTENDAKIEIGLKYQDRRWQRYTISFDPGRTFSQPEVTDDGEGQ